MRALILQMRGAEDGSRQVEQQEYLSYTGLHADQVDFVDLFDHPRFDPVQLLQYQALLIGGISRDEADEVSWPVSKFPFIHNLHAIMRLAIDQKTPALLSCGGFVIAGDMLGAKTLFKRTGFELGVYGLHKTQAATQDVFLGPVSDQLKMVSGHNKYFDQTPPGTELLLYTNEYGSQVPVHAFKVTDAPFYAFQGHPEISCAELTKRVKPLLYRQKYFPKRAGNAEDEAHGFNQQAYQAFCDLEADTSEAQALLKRFVNLVKEGAFIH